MTMTPPLPPSLWTRFWHVPVRAERLALTRILLGLALLTNQLFELYPRWEEFFGPTGVAPNGIHDGDMLHNWSWTVVFVSTDRPDVLWLLFWAWVLVTFLFVLGLGTRVMAVAVWFLTNCFMNANPRILNGGDMVLQLGVFLLMLMPTGRALSLDAWIRRRFFGGPPGPYYTPAWGVRVLQIQLCMIYCTTGLIKLQGYGIGKGTWWDGTTVHYLYNYVWMNRWSYAQLPLPLWVTAPMTFTSVWWETLFPVFMVTNKWTRRAALLFGILFHLGIWFTVEVGWFGFYTMAFYGVFTSCEFWAWWTSRKKQAPPPAASGVQAAPAQRHAPVQ
jgi:uncharacterized membrane protein YphA (DoxX/SURF4 family)